MEDAGFAKEEAVAFELRGDRDHAAEQADDRVFLGFDGFFGGEEDFEAGEDQEAAEEVDDPVPLHEGGAD